MHKMGPIPPLRPGTAARVLGALLIAAGLGLAPGAVAMEKSISPLEPADTSSPRATLKSFRENFERAFRDFYEVRTSGIMASAVCSFESAASGVSLGSPRENRG